MTRPREEILQAIRESAVPVHGARDLEPLVSQLAKSRVVMLGEASHGTAEFYSWRRIISQWLIARHGFNFVIVEGDWPDCQAINRYAVEGEGFSARETLSRFRRWPTWMWANTEIIRMAEWMRSHNAPMERERRVGFHGLDVYSFFDSMDEVVRLLDRGYPLLARRARKLYSCFDRFDRDERRYARSLFTEPRGCSEAAKEVVDLVHNQLRPERSSLARLDWLDAWQNARVVCNAEVYYRAMTGADESSWNVRDRHMAETLETMLQHYGPESKAIVWAHNTHVGDYRATEMVDQGMINLGGLARESMKPGEVALLGFGTHRGRVIASHAWEGPIQIMDVPPAKAGSWEDHFHQVSASVPGMSEFFMMMPSKADQRRHLPLTERLDHRAIGVVYEPEDESRGNYVATSLARRYDAFFYVDRTEALEPLVLPVKESEIPETWPVGF